MDFAFGRVPIVDDQVREDGNLVVGNRYVIEWHCGESEASSVVAKAFRLDNRITASDRNGNGNVKGVCAAGACDRAGDLVDGKTIAEALETLLHEHVGGATVPVYGTTFEFVHAAIGADDKGFISGRETEEACWAAHGEVVLENVAIYDMGFGWTREVNVSSSEFAESSEGRECFVSDRVAKAWLATHSNIFDVYPSID